MPSWVFWSMAWALGLIALFVLHEVDSGFARALPAKLGPLPVSVVSFGAAGGLLVSLSGIFKYNRVWNPSFDYWHACRPMLGAFIGSIGCLVFLVLTEAAEKKTGAPNSVFYAVISFSLGYREESFRALLLRLIDTVIVPAQPSAPTPATSSAASPIDANQPPAT
jgi:hypothetical protein